MIVSGGMWAIFRKYYPTYPEALWNSTDEFGFILSSQKSNMQMCI